MAKTKGLLNTPFQLVPLSGTAWRVVESQEQIHSLRWVDSMAEHDVLESLLESSKPPATEGHYLLATPFRYPPLPWGSRFGTRSEPSLFYAAESVQVALAEAAHYRGLFLRSMPPRTGARLLTHHSSFGIEYQTEKGLQLTQPPFDNDAALISDPNSYAYSQVLGAAMRKRNVEAFEYDSARHAGGVCIGIFTPAAIKSTQPQQVHQWICQTAESEVGWRCVDTGEVVIIPASD